MGGFFIKGGGGGGGLGGLVGIHRCALGLTVKAWRLNSYFQFGMLIVISFL